MQQKRNEVVVSSRRTLILVGAIAVGAIAALLILQYVSGIEDKANNETRLVPVVLVQGDIKAGEKADALIAEGRLGIGERRSIDVPAATITRLDDLKSTVAAIDLSAGDIVTSGKFAGALGNSSSSSLQLAQGMTAVTASFESARGVSNLVQPGDYVNIYVRGTESKPKAVEGEPEQADGDRVAAVPVLQKVRVLAVGKNLNTVAAKPAEGEAAVPDSDLVTFEVPPEAAGFVAALGAKELVLTLVRPDYVPRPLPRTRVVPESVLPGEVGRTPLDDQAPGSSAAQDVGR